MDTLRELILPYWPAIWKMIVAYIIALLAVAADLMSGISKAKKKGIYTHTYGIDRTLDKLRKRYNLLVVFSMIDILLIVCEFHDTMIPYATLFAVVVMCLVEIKSILEKDEDKGRYIEAAKTAAEVLKGIDKEELADVIIKKMDEKLNSNHPIKENEPNT